MSSTGSHRASAIEAAHSTIRTASSASLIVLSRITARWRTCAWTTAPNSCPECYETGAGSAAPTLPTSSPDRLATPRL